ncbi:unnamed protein product [Kuraishia capsulata CBS 1993]|uniref:Uncharacterized protein n=1 Tax=Kuraishia capsulata CBS 1993 TaxID=1382522 RepID=W6MR71_9ASCO|nr:uncharacterized protein KUCA_T00004843001 [Kuraishia capsulata CBS 1993]CDK28858.1 unnamed protein product [Kuraishia capsulata CBS 1993]
MEFHALDKLWTIWYHSKLPTSKFPKGETVVDDELTRKRDLYLSTAHEVQFPQIHTNGVEKSSECDSVEQMWQVLSNLKPPSELGFNSEIMVFQKGVQPIWEDPANAHGGKLVIKFLRKQSEMDVEAVKFQRQRCSLVWERLVLRCLGNSLFRHPIVNFEEVSEEIVGIVLSVRHDEDIISIWNRNLVEDQVVEIDETEDFGPPRLRSGPFASVFKHLVLWEIAQCTGTLLEQTQIKLQSKWVLVRYRLHSDWDDPHHSHQRHYHNNHHQNGFHKRGRGGRTVNRTHHEESTDTVSFANLGRSRRGIDELKGGEPSGLLASRRRKERSGEDNVD